MAEKKAYTVQIPIAGHAIVEVEAEDRESAIDAAFDKMTVEHLESWEGLSTFTNGNVCYCPSPWEIVVTDDATQARLVAEMARMLEGNLPPKVCHYCGGVMLFEPGDYGDSMTPPTPGAWGCDCGETVLWSGDWFHPWTSADDAIAFADWAEREGKIDNWTRNRIRGTLGTPRRHYMLALPMDATEPEAIQITPTVPFPAALSLAVCRAVPTLKAILEAGDDPTVQKCAQCERLFHARDTEAENKNFCCVACEHGY